MHRPTGNREKARAADRPRPKAAARGQSDRLRANPQAATPGDDGRRRGTFEAFADRVRLELGPRGVLERSLTELAARAAWDVDRGSRAAGRTLLRALEALGRLRDRRPRPEPGPVPAAGSADDLDDGAEAGGPTAAPPVAPETPDDGRWSSRLVFDPQVCEASPVVRGTWVTASHVVSLVVDGWSWADILRAHPELTEDDLRACLAYTVEQQEGGFAA